MSSRVAELFDISAPKRVALVSGAHGINEFYSIALPPILPLLVTDFEITYAQVGLLVTVYFVMYTIFQLPVGLVADRVDKSRLIVVGMIGLAGAFFLASVVDSYPALLATQVLAGIAGSTYHPAGMSLVSDIESEETEGRAMGLHAVGGVAGTILAPVVVGGIAALADWRLALRASAVVGLAYTATFLVLYSHPKPADGAPKRAGDGENTRRPTASRSDASTSGDGGTSTAHAAVRGARSLRDSVLGGARSLFTWWVLGLVLAKLLFGLQFGAVRTFTTSYIFDVSGGAEATSNLVFFVLLAGGGVAVIWFGGLADRFDRGRLLAGTFFVSALLIAVTIALPQSPLVLVAWFLFIGAAVYAGLPVMNTLTSQFSTEGSSGSLFGVVQTASAVGSAGAPILFGSVATAYGIDAAFPAIAVVSLIGGIVLLGFAVRVFSRK